jgi:FkbM family methyltransferase
MKIKSKISGLIKKLRQILYHPAYIHSLFADKIPGMPEDIIIQRYFHEIDDGTLIDIGAHIGKYTTLFAAKGWRCYSFEPERMNFSKLKENTKNLANVTIYDMAVSDTDEDEVSFFVSSKHWGAHSIKQWHHTHQSNYSVKCTRLDKFCEQESIKEVTFLKIDTEGNDFYVIKGFNFEQIRPELILTEFSTKRTSSHFHYDYQDMADYLSKYGYKGFMMGMKEVRLFAREGKVSPPIKFKEFCRLGEEIKGKSNDGNIIFYNKGNKKFEQLIEWFLAEQAKKYLNRWLD